MWVHHALHSRVHCTPVNGCASTVVVVRRLNVADQPTLLALMLAMLTAVSLLVPCPHALSPCAA
jgi:hypothetical protein